MLFYVITIWISRSLLKLIPQIMYLVTPKGDHLLSQRYSELYLNTLSKTLHWLSKKCRRRDSNSQPQRPLPGSIPSLMLQTARFYTRLYYHAQTRAHNLLRQKVITYWVSAIVSYISTYLKVFYLSIMRMTYFISLLTFSRSIIQLSVIIRFIIKNS